ncbi:hypothetical protein [Natrarchaeobius oligotrophus]|uniref:Uncharacterized protein n=1 Tax=Natrarchaeobius chitinivorans TaxID=1679083 RepID=A0A3N6P648_NATCH|nr:hypothetical protein [Natrarchaeobius chitinivorans]RQG93749.1 hypothetical protein EA472_22725 [Natrarchaeobius chitinivorans]
MSTEPTDASPPLPREPSAWRPETHFGQKIKGLNGDRKRHLDGDIVRGCIERGTATKVNRDIYHLREEFGGVSYTLVVDAATREVITGYPDAIDADAARESGRWSSQQIADIQHFIATDPR